MNQKSLELWKQRIADKKTSGLNLTDWCDKNNLTKHAYYYWMKRVKADIQKSDVSIPVFAEVEPEHTSPEKGVKSGLQITWHDINLTVSDSNTAKLAAEFISQLQNLC
jgi:hypothetical protein